MHFRGLSACVVCVVLNQAFDLPCWHPKFSQCAREVLRRHLDKCNFASDCLSYRPRYLCVRNCRRSRNCICLTNVIRLCQHGRSNEGNVTNIDRADACIADRREELPLIGNRCLECQEALKIEIGPQKRIADSKLAARSFDCCMAATESHRDTLRWLRTVTT